MYFTGKRVFMCSRKSANVRGVSIAMYLVQIL